MSKDLYGLLQVSPNASDDIIYAAYKVLRGSDDIEEAYRILSNKKLRKAYHETIYPVDDKGVVGSYRITKPLAEGGYGKTYLGEHILSGTKVCIKHCRKLDPDYQRILIEEWNTVCNLAHYEIPVMRDLVRLPDGTLALVMSYIPGLTLAQLIEKHGKLDAEDVAWIAERMLNACRYIHSHGVVHGDIKPQNIVVREEDHTVVLIDFGLALVKPDPSDSSKGYTDLFAPPEQIDGKVLLPESDLYSLGMTMIAAISGDADCLEYGEVPNYVPDPLANFIQRLVRSDLRKRPRWEKEDLCETIKEVRMAAFGRCESRMKQICDLKHKRR